MIIKYLHGTVFLVGVLLLCGVNLYAENIDPNEDGSQYVWGENVGWINFEPNIGNGVQVSSDKLVGWVWAENIGWISLSCENTSGCAAVNYGITNNGTGHLSGYAWGENVGWVNFDPNVPGEADDYGVTIDGDGNFDGFAWGENIGWINFGISNYYVLACKVTFEDLANFVDDWLDSGPVAGNLDSTGYVDFEDYGIFASYWLGYCPNSWPLK